MIDYALSSDMELPEELKCKLDKAARTRLFRDTAMALLGRRPCSTGELKAKLLEKGASETESEDIAFWAEDLGLLNDEEYGKIVVRHYSKKGYGGYKIKEELYRRKVPRELWDDALLERNDTTEAVVSFLQKRLREDEAKQVKKVTDALARRGYTWSEIAEGLKIFRELAEENSEVDE